MGDIGPVLGRDARDSVVQRVWPGGDAVETGMRWKDEEETGG